jgi:hypothetical protein
MEYMSGREAAVQELQKKPLIMYCQRAVGMTMMLTVSCTVRPRLRRLLLECVKPNKDGTGLPGYQPSPSFQQTWASSWADGPLVGHAADQPPPLVNEVLPLIYDALLPFLEPRDVVTMSTICSMWAQLVRSHPGYAALCKEGEQQALADKEEEYEDYYDDYEDHCPER